MEAGSMANEEGIQGLAKLGWGGSSYGWVR